MSDRIIGLGAGFGAELQIAGVESGAYRAIWEHLYKGWVSGIGVPILVGGVDDPSKVSNARYPSTSYNPYITTLKP